MMSDLKGVILNCKVDSCVKCGKKVMTNLMLPTKFDK